MAALMKIGMLRKHRRAKGMHIVGEGATKPNMNVVALRKKKGLTWVYFKVVPKKKIRCHFDHSLLM